MSCESTLPVADHFDGIAVFCSDGRFATPSEEAIRTGLQLQSCDHLAVPGGPAALVGHPEALLPGDAVLEEVAFLVEAHEVRRAALVAHDGCAFYSHRLGLGPREIRQAQEEDLVRAAHRLRQRLPELQVETFFAHRTDDGRLRLDPVAPHEG